MTINVPLWQIAVALLIPTGAYLLLPLARLPKPGNTVKLERGLNSVPYGPLQARIDEIYPEDALGKACYVRLPYGITKYSISGSADGRKVVLIHGYKIPSIVFKDVQDRLIAAGFLVLTYDIYGRGYSQAPQDTTLPVYITQLALLMQHIGWGKARIVGLSLGGAIAAGFATEFPNLVDSDVALLASVGNFTDAHPFDASYAVLTHPFFLWIYLLLAKKPTLPPPPKDPLEAIGQLHTLQMIALPHYIHLLALTVRHGPLRGMGPIFANLGKMPIRTLLVHGADDDFVEYRRYFEPALTKYFPKAKVVVLEHGRHELAATHPDEVANALVEFFNSA